MIVVADSSALITLARIGQFDLLYRQYRQLIIPPEVYEEVVEHGRGMPGSAEVGAASWIEVRPIEPASSDVRGLCAGLGRGETAAIVLSLQLRSDLLLLDEWRARRAARSLDLNIAGCVAVLEQSFAKGFLTDLRIAYIRMLREGIRVDLRILQNSLARYGLQRL